MKDIRLSILKTTAIVLIILGLFLFFVSLFEPVFITKTHSIKGYWILAMGWMGFAIFQFAWYANLLSLLVVLLMFKRPFIAFAVSLFSLLLAAESFLFDEIPLNSSKESIVITDTDVGFYLWIGAHCAILYAAVLMLIRNKMIAYAMLEKDTEKNLPDELK
ncbi:MAG: hypothetical protein KAH03_01750 [Cocleimonas sp.]|nr:hypothetical protein [Cocleimonas sp.]